MTTHIHTYIHTYTHTDFNGKKILELASLARQQRPAQTSRQPGSPASSNVSSSGNFNSPVSGRPGQPIPGGIKTPDSQARKSVPGPGTPKSSIYDSSHSNPPNSARSSTSIQPQTQTQTQTQTFKSSVSYNPVSDGAGSTLHSGSSTPGRAAVTGANFDQFYAGEFRGNNAPLNHAKESPGMIVYVCMYVCMCVCDGCLCVYVFIFLWIHMSMYTIP